MIAVTLTIDRRDVTEGMGNICGEITLWTDCIQCTSQYFHEVEVK